LEGKGEYVRERERERERERADKEEEEEEEEDPGRERAENLSFTGGASLRGRKT
jgi:hypothetical protein